MKTDIHAEGEQSSPGGEVHPGSVAIIGIAARFPDAPDPSAFWSMICKGETAFRRFAADELQDAFPDEDRQGANYVPVRPSLDKIEDFDAEFFDMRPREAALTDPQHRLFLELCWEAFEQAGYDPKSVECPVGVFAGNTMSTYLLNNVLSDREKIEEFTSNYQVGCYGEFVGAMNEALAMRVAYKLNLRGPAFTTQSACSTSLLTVTTACQNLLDFTCDMALAGGVSITVPQKRGYIALEGGMASTDGVCRPFDSGANGTVFGSGGGAVLLKRLEDAIADDDTIIAVIRGYGINNDGSDKVGFAAPSVNGQAEAIVTALANADVEPETISYIECHGTATPIGDPIEFKGILQAYGKSDGVPCRLGSVKGNVGHLDAAAGICGLIKTSLSLQNGTIPGTANFQQINPRIELGDTRYSVSSETGAWPATETRRRAGVSAFGVGGTNIHVVLEEPPSVPANEIGDVGPVILPLSARTPEALAARQSALAAHLLAKPDQPLASIAHTLQTGRHAFSHRSAVVASTVEEAAERLSGNRLPVAEVAETPPPVVFMFPGQGAQYVGMAAMLYASEPEFAKWIDRGCEQLKPVLDLDLRDFLCHGGDVSSDLAEAQRETRIAQPCLYLVEYALAQLWMSRGLKPDAMIGHSVGEFVAATLAGVMTFEDGLSLVAARGSLMQQQLLGAMVSVRSDAQTVSAHLIEGVEIAATNAPKLVVISGPFDVVDEVCTKLEEAEIAFSRLHTSHAFHSAMMEDAASALRGETDKVVYGKARIPYVSCVTGNWQTEEQGASPDYWARHCRDAVRFSEGLQTLCDGKKPVLIECGPGRTLSVFAAQTIAREAIAAVVQSLPEHDRADAAVETFATAHGRLWMAGCALSWPTLPAAAKRKVPLPTYPFQRQRHWIDAPLPIRRNGTENRTAPQMTSATRITTSQGAPEMNVTTPVTAVSRIAQLQPELLTLLSDVSGEELGEADMSATFLELGFDSLFIGQFAQKLEKQFKVKLSFRELLGNIPTVADLAVHLDSEMPAEAVPAPVMPSAGSVADVPQASAPVPSHSPVAPQLLASTNDAPAGSAQSVMQKQLEVAQTLFAQQLQALQGLGGAPVQSSAALPPTLEKTIAPVADPAVTSVSETVRAPLEGDVEFGNDRIKLYKPKTKNEGAGIDPGKSEFIARLTRDYAQKSPKSKAFADANRAHLADPRTASGFREEWKEMVFPVVSDRSKGSRIWDIDGNEYIDLVNGFGQTAFGHAPDFVLDAVRKQMESGFAIGPQTPLAGKVAKLICDMTGHERVTFCNTGSEAVMAAMRVARAVTGNERVVVFANDYHGQFDEVLVKGRSRSGSPIALPIASGIPTGSVSNMTVLKYGDPESLAWIKANTDDIAAVIVEPIQSRHPEFRPVEFVRELRDVATKAGFALVFDEVVTGFRVDPGGVQSIWGIKGDMATYGKVIGGGMPIGVLAGDSRFMDALDGGAWAYGDDSIPMTAPTFFAGTFVRHPLVLAAAQAVLEHIRGEGADLYHRVAPRTEALLAEIQTDLSSRGIINAVHGYKSWISVHFTSEDPLGSLMFAQLRLRGIHVLEGYPLFFTTAHTEADFQAVAQAFRESADALQSVGILLPAGSMPVSENPAAAAKSLPPASARVESAPLTEAQQEVWLSAQTGDEASCSFNECFTLTIEGEFDEVAFRESLDLVIARHDAFHIHFARDGSHFTFLENFTLDVTGFDLLGEADREDQYQTLLQDEANTPFDLVDGPLVRAYLVRMDARIHKLVMTAHHIICDGWSINVLVDDLRETYNAKVEGQKAELAPALSFATYATELAPKPDARGATAQYWLGEYATVPELHDMPLDRNYPEYRTFKGGTRTGHIDADVSRKLKKTGGKSGATLFSTLLSIVQVFVARLSGSDDIVIAIPSAGQNLLEGQTLVGHCVNLLPIRQSVETKAPFEAHLKATQQKVLQAFEHQDYTYGTLVRELGLKRDPRRLPLTGIQFNLERMASGEPFGSATGSVQPNPKAFSNFDMFLNMIEGPDGIRIDVDYNGDVLDAETVDRWIGHIATMAAALADEIGKPIHAIPLLDDAQRNHLVSELNDSTTKYDRNLTIPAMISAKVGEQPGAIAVRHGAEALTYDALEKRANQFARHVQTQVPGKHKRVAVLVDRSIDMLVCLLGIMKSGHAYVPLDTGHPEARIRKTLAAADIGALVCMSGEMAAMAPGNVEVIRLDTDAGLIAALSDEAPDCPADAGADPAYVIFTSGSTGEPKGVEISHGALSNFMVSMAREPGFSPDDCLVAVTTISFDIAALELYLPLVAGGAVVIGDRDAVQDGYKLVDLIKTSGATVMQATPTLWRMLTEAGLGNQPDLKILCGGEPLPADLANNLLETGREVWNMYGPTESTIWSSVCRIMTKDAAISIGHPIANTQLHIVDDHGNIAPLGVPGELLIGGDGLANGYFGREDLTAKAFVELDIGDAGAKRFYRTGDVGKRLNDGSLQLLGRRDGQIKLRGFRIEIGDVEAVLTKADGIRQSAVVVAKSGNGDKQLVGYIVAENAHEPPSSDVISNHMRQELPSYMVPSFFVPIDTLPLTGNGKLDRKALERLGMPQRTAKVERKQPATEMEKRLYSIWQDVLQQDDISVDDNIYALGGDSLSIFRIASRMMDAGLPLEAKHLLRHPSIAELSRYADEKAAEGSKPPVNGMPSLREFRAGARRASVGNVQ